LTLMPSGVIQSRLSTGSPYSSERARRAQYSRVFAGNASSCAFALSRSNGSYMVTAAAAFTARGRRSVWRKAMAAVSNSTAPA
jgi:hypothetical protein